MKSAFFNSPTSDLSVRSSSTTMRLGDRRTLDSGGLFLAGLARRFGFTKHRDLLDFRRRSRFALHFAAGRQAIAQRFEFQFVEQCFHLRAIVGMHRAVLPRHVERHVGANGDEVFAEKGHVPIGFQCRLGARGCDLCQMIVDVLNRAVLLQQLRRALLADAFHAGDVVAGVAFERLEIDELLRRQAKALFDQRFIVQHRVLIHAALT